MKTIDLTGRVNEQHRLELEVPATVPPGSVKVVLLVPDIEGEDSSDGWLQLIVKNWEAELSDPREDIYTLEDGEPVDRPG